MNRRLRYIPYLLVFLFLLSYSLKAQNFTSNPYSMYGVGEIHTQTNIVSGAMGDAGLGLSNSQFINLLNPASYCNIDSLSFLTNMGVESKHSKFETKSEASHTHDVNLSYIAIGFRPKKWLGMGFGINPFSTAGYNIETDTDINGIYTYPLKISGSGNINRIYMTFSVNPMKNLYLGINNSFLFGKLKQTQYHDLSSISSLSVVSEITNEYKNFFWEFGMQYKVNLKKDQSLTIGAIFTPKQHLATDSEIMTYNTNGTIYDIDDDISDNNNFSIPSDYGLGIAFSKGNKYTFLLDGGIQYWSKSDYDLMNSVTLTNSPYLKTGFEYTPSRYFMDKYYKKISYRVGYHFQKSYIKFGSYQQYENTISCGFGLPLNNTHTRIDLSFEAGKNGNIGSARIFQEKFFRVKLGLSLIDLWFTKRKYD